MAMPALARFDWTVDMLDELPEDGQRYEIIDGELFVSPSPRREHQLVLGELYGRFYGYLRHRGVARALFSPSDIRKPDTRKNRVQPDLFVFRLGDGTPADFPFDLKDLLLVIEVLSPSTKHYDYQKKRALYMSAGIPEYWVVDIDARHFSRFTDAAGPGQLLTDRIDWHSPGIEVPLSIDIAALFDEAIGSSVSRS